MGLLNPLFEFLSQSPIVNKANTAWKLAFPLHSPHHPGLHVLEAGYATNYALVPDYRLLPPSTCRTLNARSTTLQLTQHAQC